MKYSMLGTLSVLLLLLLVVQNIVCPPVDPSQKMKPATAEEAKQEEDLGLEYGKYLQQVVQILEQDKDFAKKLENVSSEDIKSGKVAKELEFVNHSVRSRLDELKRIELDRLRGLIRKEVEHNELGVYNNEKNQLEFPADMRRWRSLPKAPGDGVDRGPFGDLQHLDFKNPHTFEVEDLRKLIKTASKDLDEINAKRKEEFKQYELEKEHQYRENLKHMPEEERKLAESKHQESLNRHKEHPKIHHPGSKQQLEQVWEEQDNLPRQEFNPSTFFAMHDINGDGHLDEEEVEAILSLEIKKMYDSNNSDDDPVEMMEEYHRMREHIYNETDYNKDGLISKEEFMEMTRKAEFNQDEGWKGLDEERVYTDDELLAYEEHLRQLAMSQNLQYQQGGVPPYHPGMGVGYHPDVPQQGQGGPPPHYPPQQGQYQQHPQQGQYQQHPEQGQYQQHPQQGQNQQQPPQHGQFQQPPQHGQFQQHPQQGQFQQHPQQGQFQQHPQQGQFQQHPQQGQFQQHPQQGQFQQHPQQGQFQQHPQQGQFQQPPQQGQIQQHSQQGQVQQGQYQPQGGQFQQPPQEQNQQHASPPQGNQVHQPPVQQNQPIQSQNQQVPIQAASIPPAVPVAGQGSVTPISNQPSSQQPASQNPVK